MKNLAAHPTLPLLTGGFVLFAVLAFVRAEEAAPRPAPWQPVADVAPPPSADNVAPAVHARLMGLEERLESAPDDTTALLDLARLQQDAHQHETAAGHYERFLALSPRNHQVWLDLANAYAGADRWGDARDASERMLALYPGDPSAMYNLGAIAANEGDTGEARRWWQSVRDGADATLAARAETSLAQLDALASAPTSASPSRPAAARPNPHAGLGQPVVAHRASVLGGTE